MQLTPSLNMGISKRSAFLDAVFIYSWLQFWNLWYFCFGNKSLAVLSYQETISHVCLTHEQFGGRKGKQGLEGYSWDSGFDQTECGSRIGITINILTGFGIWFDRSPESETRQNLSTGCAIYQAVISCSFVTLGHSFLLGANLHLTFISFCGN